MEFVTRPIDEWCHMARELSIKDNTTPLVPVIYRLLQLIRVAKVADPSKELIDNALQEVQYEHQRSFTHDDNRASEFDHLLYGLLRVVADTIHEMTMTTVSERSTSTVTKEYGSRTTVADDRLENINEVMESSISSPLTKNTSLQINNGASSSTVSGEFRAIHHMELATESPPTVSPPTVSPPTVSPPTVSSSNGLSGSGENRNEVLTHLPDDVSVDRRNELGSFPGGRRLCERTLSDLIYMAVSPPTSSFYNADDGRGHAAGNVVDHQGRGGVVEGALPCRSASVSLLQTRRAAVCPGEQIQKAAFQLLHHLCVNSYDNMQVMHKIFYELFYERTPWKDKRDFDYMPHHVLRGDDFDNSRVQLERVQYSQHYFHYVFEMSHAALEMMHHTHLDDTSRNLLGFSVMRTFASFVVHNGLFASDDLRRNDNDYDNKPPLLKWLDMFTFLLSSSDAARIWFVTNILFVPEIVACFLFSSAPQVREFFSDLILRTIHTTEVKGDLTERCYETYAQTDHVLQLHSTMVDFPRLSYLLIHLLGKLPTKYLSLFRSEFIDFYRLIYNITVSHIGLLTAIIRGGLFNSLLMLFSSTASSHNIHSLNRRDNQVYEMVLKLVSCGIRAIRRDEAEEDINNCYRFTEVAVQRRDVPDLQVLINFLSKDGGHVRYVHCLVDLIRRTSRALSYAWATDACLFLAYGNPSVSATIIDAICQGSATILTERGQATCAKLARALFALPDGLEEARFSYLFHDAQLSNPHTASVHGFLEIESIPKHRFEPMVLILLQALEVLPGINEMISQDEKVRRLLTQINARAICRRNSSVPFNQFHNWYAAEVIPPAPSSNIAP